LYISLPWFC